MDVRHRCGLKRCRANRRTGLRSAARVDRAGSAPERGGSRLLHYKSADRAIAHRTFSDLPGLLGTGDLLVFNDTRVIPARFTLQKVTGGRVEGLYLATTDNGDWHVMLKNLGKQRVGPNNGDSPPYSPCPQVHANKGDATLYIKGRVPFISIPVIVVGQEPDGTYTIRAETDLSALEVLGHVGRMPLPPYIKRDKDRDARDDDDRARYQTVYAANAGSVAAPTAGLHFTDPLLRELDDRGVQRAHVTLHVGLGTFKPVTADALDAHEMHEETYSIDARAADLLNHAKREGRRIIAVGTTAARVLESQPADEKFAAKVGATRIFIYPPYDWRHVDALITNFHLPRSTLIALVAAKVGLDEQRRIYREAIDHRYRFFSYGDASFLE